MATKAYFVLVIPIVVLHAARRARARGEPWRPLLADLALTQLVLPASLVLLSYFRWFGRGYSLPEFVQLQADAFRTLRELTVERFPHGASLLLRGAPWEWFLRPISVGRQVGAAGGETARFLLEINNPPFRLLVIPAVIAVTVHAWRRRSLEPLLVPSLLAAVYLPALAAGRPIFSYSALPLLPLAYLVVAHALSLVAARTRHGGALTTTFLGASVLWGLYAFPLVSALPVPTWLYAPILGITTLLGGA
jgi:dolichyl-phosphate-mannose--protein O-mannosyl transferase